MSKSRSNDIFLNSDDDENSLLIGQSVSASSDGDETPNINNFSLLKKISMRRSGNGITGSSNNNSGSNRKKHHRASKQFSWGGGGGSSSSSKISSTANNSNTRSSVFKSITAADNDQQQSKRSQPSAKTPMPSSTASSATSQPSRVNGNTTTNRNNLIHRATSNSNSSTSATSQIPRLEPQDSFLSNVDEDIDYQFSMNHPTPSNLSSNGEPIVWGAPSPSRERMTKLLLLIQNEFRAVISWSILVIFIKLCIDLLFFLSSYQCKNNYHDSTTVTLLLSDRNDRSCFTNEWYPPMNKTISHSNEKDFNVINLICSTFSTLASLVLYILPKTSVSSNVTDAVQPGFIISLAFWLWSVINTKTTGQGGKSTPSAIGSIRSPSIPSLNDDGVITPNIPTRVCEMIMKRLTVQELLVIIPIHIVSVLTVFKLASLLSATTISFFSSTAAPTSSSASYTSIIDPKIYGNDNNMSFSTIFYDFLNEVVINSIFCVGILVIPELLKVNKLSSLPSISLLSTIVMYPIYTYSVASSNGRIGSTFSPNLMYALYKISDNDNDKENNDTTMGILTFLVRCVGPIFGGLLGGKVMLCFFPDE